MFDVELYRAIPVHLEGKQQYLGFQAPITLQTLLNLSSETHFLLHSIY